MGKFVFPLRRLKVSIAVFLQYQPATCEMHGKTTPRLSPQPLKTATKMSLS